MNSFEITRELRKQGKRLGRAGMSQRVIHLVEEFVTEGGTYKGAMVLAGRLHAISLASRCDSYWGEKTNHGFHRELYDITQFVASPVEDE